MLLFRLLFTAMITATAPSVKPSQGSDLACVRLSNVDCGGYQGHGDGRACVQASSVAMVAVSS